MFALSHIGNKAPGNIKTSKMAQFTSRDGRDLKNPMKDICKKLQTAINIPVDFVLAFPDCFCFIQATCVAAVTICNDSCCSGILEQSWRRADKLQHHCLAPLPWALSDISTSRITSLNEKLRKNSCCTWCQVGFLFQIPGHSVAFRWAVRCGQFTGHLKPFSKLSNFYYCILLNHPCQRPEGISYLNPSVTWCHKSNPLPSSTVAAAFRQIISLWFTETQKYWMINSSRQISLQKEVRGAAATALQRENKLDGGSRSGCVTAKPRCPPEPEQGGCSL